MTFLAAATASHRASLGAVLAHVTFLITGTASASEGAGSGRAIVALAIGGTLAAQSIVGDGRHDGGRWRYSRRPSDLIRLYQHGTRAPE